jgi:cytochrome b561
MQNEVQPRDYSGSQIVLHWIIAALVVVQLVLGKDIAPAYRAMRRGTEASAADLFNADIHVYLGLAILALACLRFGIRFFRGVPAAPAGESVFQKWTAAAAHFLLYLTIFGMPITGLLAWYLGIHVAGEVHSLAKPVIIAVVLLHAAGALWQHFVAKSDVLVRMLWPGARRAAAPSR